MTRFAIDPPVALRLVLEEATLGAGHQVVAPGSLRSEVLALLYDQVRAGVREERQALALLELLASTKMRLLADRVSRRVAWTVAAELDLPETRLAEYVAVAQLQADVLITDDPALRRVASSYVPTGDWSELAAALTGRSRGPGYAGRS